MTLPIRSLTLLSGATFAICFGACSFFQPASPPAVYQEPPPKEYKKPWKTTREKKRVMVTIAARLLQSKKDPVKNACVEKVIKQLNRPAAEIPRFEERDPKCEKVMTKCGACHLPRANICQYRITWAEGKKKYVETLFVEQLEAEHLLMMRVKSQVFLNVKFDGKREPIWTLNNGEKIRGRMIKSDSESVTVRVKSGVRRLKIEELQKWQYRRQDLRRFVRDHQVFEGQAQRIPIKQIEKIEWINGGDPLATWWDFKRFSPRGRKARRMFDIAVRHRVGCTNCHVGHGDFRLTHEGRVFQESGRVIRRVPLEDFLRGR